MLLRSLRYDVSKRKWAREERVANWCAKFSVMRKWRILFFYFLEVHHRVKLVALAVARLNLTVVFGNNYCRCC